LLIYLKNTYKCLSNNPSDGLGLFFRQKRVQKSTHTNKNGKYYVSFSDANNHHQKIEVTQEVFESFNKFELDDISNINEYDRHIEHSEIH
jgi:hypothetical protein